MLQLQFIIVPLVALVLVAAAVFAFVMAHRAMSKPSPWVYHNRSWMDSGWSLAAIFGAVFAGVMVVVVLVMFIPFNAKYLTFNHVEGTIQSVSNRFVDGTGDLSSDFALRLDGEPGVYSVQDSRIQGVKTGDHVDLTCTVEWVYAGEDKNNCFIRSWR